MAVDDYVEPEVAAAVAATAALSAAVFSPPVRRALRHGVLLLISGFFKAREAFNQMVAEAAPGGAARKRADVRQADQLAGSMITDAAEAVVASATGA